MDAQDSHGGLGWIPVVVDAKLSAPRGEEHTNARQEGYDGDSLFEGEEDVEDTFKATLDTHIPETNIGFKLLLKMGWTQGRGLGRNGNGIVEPVRTGVEDGVRLGLGKQEQDDFYTASENVQRKRLETEIQATEDEARRERREALAEREAKIKQEVAEIKKTYYCETCHKQYNTAMELDQHLSSYDHHHKKRLVEMKAMSAERTKAERLRKEAKQMDREMALLNKQIQRAAAQGSKPVHAGSQSLPPPAPPQPPPPPSQPPLPSDQGTSASHGHTGWGASTISSASEGAPAQSAAEPSAPPPPPPPPAAPITGTGISFGLGKKPLMGLGRGRGGPAVQRGGMMGGARAKPAQAAGVFAMSDSDEEEGKA